MDKPAPSTAAVRRRRWQPIRRRPGLPRRGQPVIGPPPGRTTRSLGRTNLPSVAAHRASITSPTRARLWSTASASSPTPPTPQASVSSGVSRPAGIYASPRPAGFGGATSRPWCPAPHELHPGRLSLNLSDRIVDPGRLHCAVRVQHARLVPQVSVRLADNAVCVWPRPICNPSVVSRMPGRPPTQPNRLLTLSSDASQTRGWAFPRNPGSNTVHYVKPAGPLDCSDGQVLHDWCLAGHGVAWRTWEVEAEVAMGVIAVLEDCCRRPTASTPTMFPQRQYLALRVRWIGKAGIPTSNPDSKSSRMRGSAALKRQHRGGQNNGPPVQMVAARICSDA